MNYCFQTPRYHFQLATSITLKTFSRYHTVGRAWKTINHGSRIMLSRFSQYRTCFE